MARRICGVRSAESHQQGIEKLQPRIEQRLRRHRATVELRAPSAEEVSYEVKLPIQKSTDALSNAIVRLDDASAVEWEEQLALSVARQEEAPARHRCVPVVAGLPAATDIMMPRPMTTSTPAPIQTGDTRVSTPVCHS